ncbi:UNVERIFIED_ORG: uncharacterized protein YceH (UPF0502 family) [Arthrobacter sp. UYCu721]
MTRRVALPTESEIRAALAELTRPDGRPSVVALARSLGLANATFWRHFPEIAQEVADARRNALRSAHPADAPATTGSDAKSAIAQLRNEKAHLRDQLEVAVAHIQRLTLENRTLREELERATKVVRIPRNRPAGDSLI